MKRQITEIVRVLRVVQGYGPGMMVPEFLHAEDPSGVFHVKLLAQAGMIRAAEAPHAVVGLELTWAGQEMLDLLSNHDAVEEAQQSAEATTGDRDNLTAVLRYLKEVS